MPTAAIQLKSRMDQEIAKTCHRMDCMSACQNLAGIDPIHLGIIMVVNMETGMITPPVGLNLFVTAGVAGMSMLNVVRAAAPWLAIMFLFLIIVTYVPFVSTWLPTLMMRPEIITK